jgi:hypothetical protein
MGTDMMALQRFYAHLAIALCVFKPPPGKFIDDQTQNRPAYSVAVLLLKAYIRDCYDLVVDAVKKRINRRGVDAKEAKRLKADLIKWKSVVDPLAYSRAGGPSDNSTLNIVIRLVVEKAEDMRFGLNMAKPISSMTYTEFGSQLYAMGRRSNPAPNPQTPTQYSITLARIVPSVLPSILDGIPQFFFFWRAYHIRKTVQRVLGLGLALSTHYLFKW